jgi:hypothetical protein
MAQRTMSRAIDTVLIGYSSEEQADLSLAEYARTVVPTVLGHMRVRWVQQGPCGYPEQPDARDREFLDYAVTFVRLEEALQHLSGMSCLCSFLN